MNCVYGMYFSATETTEKVVCSIGRRLAASLGREFKTVDFTLPAARENGQSFEKDDIVVFGTPVYAGRVPNILLKFIHKVQGNGAYAVPVVVYGNRNYDDALAELKALMAEDGFLPVSGAAFIGEHSFSTVLAVGRPDAADMEKIEVFADKSSEKIKGLIDGKTFQQLEVSGEYPSKGYFQPTDRKGNPVNILKVRPKTNENCNQCGLCAKVCPMGSISFEDAREYTGICIKCGSCVKKCPTGAKYYDDPAYLYHLHEVEEGNKRRAEPEMFY